MQQQWIILYVCTIFIYTEQQLLEEEILKQEKASSG